MPDTFGALYERFTNGVPQLSYLDKQYGESATLRHGDIFRFVGENNDRRVTYWEYDISKDELYVELS